LLNALTIVTEFIGISLGMDFLGVPKIIGVGLAAVFIMLSASTGDFRRFERFSLILVAGSLLLVPILVMVHPPMTQVAHDFLVPQMPAGGKLADVMLLIIGIVGTTVAPWQLFFQQSYLIDKRITPRFISYERADLWLGTGGDWCGGDDCLYRQGVHGSSGVRQLPGCRRGSPWPGQILWPPARHAVCHCPD
jgi:Mn2+/Fe2+ NRAMP family transporter